MSNIDIKDYYIIDGGLSITSTLINSLSSAVRIVLELGRSLGSALRRGSNKTKCKI